VGYRLAVFDFDGTLVDTGAAIVAAVNDALERCGYPTREAGQILDYVGLPLARVLSGLARTDRTGADLRRLTAIYRERFDVHVAGTEGLFPGIRGLLQAATRAGIELAIATSRSRKSLVRILETLHLTERFGFLVTDGCVENGKPHPEMLLRTLGHFRVDAAEALMIGDTRPDIEMGRAAGVDTCAVVWGYNPVRRLRAAQPTYVAETVRELAPLLGV
jgi:phosphoglycolate phosphatase